jgi:glycosyltransferase involved in cell wall biosynthesis
MPASEHGFQVLPFMGLIGSGLVGTDPFDRRSFSGISYYFFSECKKQGLLADAFGCELGGWRRWMQLARAWHPNRNAWRMRYYLSDPYRNSLTQIMARKLRGQPQGRALLQVGAMLDGPAARAGGGYSYSYHDATIAMRLRNPFGSHGMSKTFARKAMAFERKVYQKIDRIFVMGDFVGRSFEQDFDIPPERIVNISHGANLDTIPDPPDGKDYSIPEILFIAKEFDRKGGPALTRAFARIRQRHPNAMLHVLGSPTPPPQDTPMEGVQWHGFLRKEIPAENERLQGLFKRCSVFALPSLYEPYGISVSEAMLYGLPAIITGDWGVAEKVEPGVSGFHVRPGHEDDIAAALDDLLGNPAKAAAMGLAARTRALDRFTWPNVIQRMRAAIEAASESPPLSASQA